MKTPIAMRCTREQFNAIKSKLPFRYIDMTGAFTDYPLLTNYYNSKPNNFGFTTKILMSRDSKLYKTWNEKMFLNSCGIKIEKPIRTNKLVELEKRVEVLEAYNKQNSVINMPVDANLKPIAIKYDFKTDVFKAPSYELLLKAIKECKIEIPNTEKSIEELKNYKPIGHSVDWGFENDKSVVSVGDLRSGKQHYITTFNGLMELDFLREQNTKLKLRIEELEAEKETILKGTIDERKINEVELPISGSDLKKIPLSKFFTGWIKIKSPLNEKYLGYSEQGVIKYGISCEGNWFDGNDGEISNDDYAANELEVLEALKNEAVKRGYKEGLCIKSLWNDGRIKTCESDIYYNGFSYNQLLFGHHCCVFMNGKWAEIIPKITKEQPEKELGKQEKKTITGWYKHSKKEYPKWLMFIDFEKDSFWGFDTDGNYVKDNWSFAGMLDYFQITKLKSAKKSEVIKRFFKKTEFELKR